MKPTRLADLLITAGVVALLAYLLVRAAYGVLPSLPPLAGVTLAVLAVVELALAYTLKSRIERKPGTRPVQPLVAARAVALAKASAVAGAVMAGVWLGLLAFLLPRRSEITAAADDTPSAVIGAACAIALVAAALWLQHCCRTPEDPEERSPQE